MKGIKKCNMFVGYKVKDKKIGRCESLTFGLANQNLMFGYPQKK
jgi:hypothetical protein